MKRKVHKARKVWNSLYGNYELLAMCRRGAVWNLTWRRKKVTCLRCIAMEKKK